MKKEALFILPSFDIGGTTVSTCNLISVLDKERYNITVWALNDEGLLRWIYDGVTLLPTNCIARSLAMSGWRSAGKWQRRIGSVLIRCLAHKMGFQDFLIKMAVKKSIGLKQFDTIVSCQEGLSTYFAAQVPGHNHVAWIRCDYKRYFEVRGRHKESVYEKFNHIVCVSEKTRDGFAEIYPGIDNRIICIYNPQNSGMIISQSEINDHDMHFLTDKKVIVSIGRISNVKRFSLIPTIAKELRDLGVEFRWYIIGDGDELETKAIKDAIEENHIEDCVLMLGAKANPHYYIKRANLYVCLSSSEACPRVINEAKILGTPVVSTDFPTVYEYLEDGINGRISSIDNIPLVISDMLLNKEEYNRIKEELSNFKFDNSSLIEQLNNIL